MASTIRTALETYLKANTGVTSLLSSPNAVYHRKAPQTAKPPCVVFDKRPGSTVVHTMGGGPAIDTETWVIRGFAFGRTAERAEDIGKALDAALVDAPLSLSGRKLLAIYRESDVDYPEQVGKELFQHCGGVYRIVSQRTPS